LAAGGVVLAGAVFCCEKAGAQKRKSAVTIRKGLNMGLNMAAS
jgi:hypothetical protein